MKVLLALGIVMFASAAAGAANAAPPDYSDFIVISVVPRSPTVQPIVMSIPVKDEKPAPRQADAPSSSR